MANNVQVLTLEADISDLKSSLKEVTTLLKGVDKSAKETSEKVSGLNGSLMAVSDAVDLGMNLTQTFKDIGQAIVDVTRASGDFLKELKDIGEQDIFKKETVQNVEDLNKKFDETATSVSALGVSLVSLASGTLSSVSDGLFYISTLLVNMIENGNIIPTSLGVAFELVTISIKGLLLPLYAALKGFDLLAGTNYANELYGLIDSVKNTTQEYVGFNKVVAEAVPLAKDFKKVTEDLTKGEQELTKAKNDSTKAIKESNEEESKTLDIRKKLIEQLTLDSAGLSNNKKASEERIKLQEKEAASAISNKVKQNKRMEEEDEKSAAKLQATLEATAYIGGLIGNVFSEASDALGGFYDQQAEKGKITEKQAFNRKKALALGQLAIDTAAGIVGFLASPPSQLSLGIAAAAPIAALIATSGIQAGVIASQKPPSFHTGLTPTEFSATLDKGEAVLNRRAVQSLGTESISSLNNGSGSGNKVIQLVLNGKVLDEVLFDIMGEPTSKMRKRIKDFTK